MLAAVALVAALVPALSPSAGAQPLDHVDAADADVSPDEARLIRRADEAGSIRVLAWLHDAPRQRAVVDELRGTTAAVLTVYDAFPVLLVEADAGVVRALAVDARVRGLAEDVAVPPTLASSLPVINADDVHTAGFDGGGTVVAIIDSGIDSDHPFFAGRLVAQACFSNLSGFGSGTSLCPNGSPSQLTGNAANVEIPACLDGSANICVHGSHVAGIAAGNATAGTPGAPGDGVAPDAGIMAIQVFSRFDTDALCGPTTPGDQSPCVLSFVSDQLLGLQHVVDLVTSGALLPDRVVAANMSLGDGQFPIACDTDPAKAAIDTLLALNVATIISAGNEGFLNAVGAPGCISTAITVGATNDLDAVAGFSNRGPLLDVFAPGVSIDSASPDDTYVNFQGTSMAAPHVAGAWALLRDAYPCESVAQTAGRLMGTGVPITYSNGIGNVTTPRIDVLAAVAPNNDDFGDAQTLTGIDLSTCGTNVTAAPQAGEPVHAGVGGGASVWYRWTPLAAGPVTIDTFGSDFDTVLAAYVGPSVGALTEVASNDDALGLTSEIAFTAAANTTYHIAVDGFHGFGSTSTGSITLNLDQPDTTPPLVTVVAPAEGASVPQGATVLATYSCFDPPGGAGLSSCVGDVASGSPIDTATLGPKTFTVTGTDNAGNATTVTRTYTVTDVTPPQVTVISPIEGASYARGTPVTALYSCLEEVGGSGVASCVGDVASGSPIATATLGPKTFTVTGTDNAGNTATVTRTYTVVDVTPPLVTVTSPIQGAIFARGTTVNALYTCLDEPGGSGLASCAGTVASGSPIDTATAGLKTFAVTGTDNAGNATTVTRTYNVVAVLPADLTPDTYGLVDPTQGAWHLVNEANDVTSFFFGNPGDTPVMGDWDCDGVDTPGLFRTSDAFAYLSNENRSKVADTRFFFGDAADLPLAGDFDGNGCDTLSIYRPSEGRFYIINELGEDEGGLGAADFSFAFGDLGDKPVVGDWDGDGIDEVGLHRESTGFFYWRNTLSTGIADGQIFFGDPGDRFVAGDWGNVDGKDSPAVFRPEGMVFFFRHTLTQGNADAAFIFGEPPWLPVAGVFGLG